MQHLKNHFYTPWDFFQTRIVNDDETPIVTDND